MTITQEPIKESTQLTASQKRRNRRKKIQIAKSNSILNPIEQSTNTTVKEETVNCKNNILDGDHTSQLNTLNMSSKDEKSREEVKAAREAKKLAKQKAKNKDKSEISKESIQSDSKGDIKSSDSKVAKESTETKLEKESTDTKVVKESTKQTSKDEVDKAVKIEAIDDRDMVKAERAAKKAAKQAKKKGAGESGDVVIQTAVKTKPSEDMTVKDVVETLRDIKNVALEVKEVTAKVQAMDLEGKKDDSTKAQDSSKSKAELRAERRAKQEAQRAAKQAAQQEKPAPKEAKENKPSEGIKKKPSPKPKSEKTKAKPPTHNGFDWFGDFKEFDKEKLNKIPINSHLHPAIVKLGVQLATKVVSGSNARCIALLDALKKMVRDYSLPAKTEFGRGLEAHLAASVEFLWSMRPPTASQTNALKCFRHHLNQLPNNVDEFDAKKTLQEEIDRYIREQIDMAGEAISIAVQKKISDGDTILTYGCSSLIERILCEAHDAGVKFRVVVCGAGGGALLARRLTARGLRCVRVDLDAINFVMSSVSKVLLGACALLGNGSVVGALGTTATALAARALNRPVLVACETHKFTEHVHTDALAYNEIGDPDDIFDTQSEDSPLKDWRSKPNLTVLNLTYDITPPSLITAVVTELAILPCTSAPVVLRFKLSEYGI